MKRLDLAQATDSLATYVQNLGEGNLVIIQDGQPVAVLMPITEDQNDTIVGEKGNDELIGNDGNDTLIGKKGNDRLLGGNGNDNLEGSNGNDLIDGGSGSDHFFCGRGKDIVMLERELFDRDIIHDFRDRQDKFAFDQRINLGKLSIEQRGKNTQIFFRNDLLAIVKGVDADNITRADFKLIKT